MARKKMVAFDFDTKKLEEYYTSVSGAYQAMYREFGKNGFEHIQGSVYVSNERLTEHELRNKMTLICEHLPWIEECQTSIRVANIGRDFDISDTIHKACQQMQNMRDEWAERVSRKREAKSNNLHKNNADSQDYNNHGKTHNSHAQKDDRNISDYFDER